MLVVIDVTVIIDRCRLRKALHPPSTACHYCANARDCTQYHTATWFSLEWVHARARTAGKYSAKSRDRLISDSEQWRMIIRTDNSHIAMHSRYARESSACELSACELSALSNLVVDTVLDNYVEIPRSSQSDT